MNLPANRTSRPKITARANLTLFHFLFKTVFRVRQLFYYIPNQSGLQAESPVFAHQTDRLTIVWNIPHPERRDNDPLELQSLLILFGISAAASMDSFSAVLAYSAAGIHIPPRSVWTLGLVSGGLLGLSVLAGSRLGALGAVAQIAGAVLLILLGAGKLAGSWLRSLAARLAEQGPYTFSAWDRRFMLSVYADPTRADADRSGDLTVREAALLAAVLSVDGIATGLGAGPGLELAWAAVPVAVLCSLLAVVAGQCSGHLLRQKASVIPDSLGAALLVLMGLIRLAGQAT